MSYVIEHEMINTPAGEYTIIFHADEHAEQPYDYGFVLIVNGGRDRIDIDHDEEKSAPRELHSILKIHADWNDHWDYELRSGTAVVRWLTLLGKKGVTLVDSDYRSVDATADRFDHFAGIAWCADDAIETGKYTFMDYTRIFLEQWQAWGEGDVFGYTITAPDGTELDDSCWGFYGFDREKSYVMDTARDAIEYDVDQRTKKANLVGAGIVGLI